jgi:hypothetical protein
MHLVVVRMCILAPRSIGDAEGFRTLTILRTVLDTALTYPRNSAGGECGELVSECLWHLPDSLYLRALLSVAQNHGKSTRDVKLCIYRAILPLSIPLIS